MKKLVWLADSRANARVTVKPRDSMFPQAGNKSRRIWYSSVPAVIIKNNLRTAGMTRDRDFELLGQS